MRKLAAALALALVAVLTVALIAHAVFDNPVAAWIAIGVTAVICVAAITVGTLPSGDGTSSDT